MQIVKRTSHIPALTLSLIISATCAGAKAIDSEYKKDPDTESWGTFLSRIVLGSPSGQFDESFALVIGVGNYGEGWRKLDASVLDAVRVANYLINDAKFDYVVTLTDDDATKDRIEQLMMSTFPNRVGPRDRFFFYFSGHGTQEIQGDGRYFGYLALSKSVPNKSWTMIEMDRIEKWDVRLRDARQTLFVLDSCFSGLAGRVPKGPLIDKRLERLAAYGHHLLTAGTKDQESWQDRRRWNGSLFTDSFLKGIAGAADSATEDHPKDGIISLKELTTYIEQRIDEEAVRLKQAYPGRLGIELSPQIRDLAPGNEGEFFFIAKGIQDQASKHSATKAYRGEKISKGPQSSVGLTDSRTVRRPTPNLTSCQSHDHVKICIQSCSVTEERGWLTATAKVENHSDAPLQIEHQRTVLFGPDGERDAPLQWVADRLENPVNDLDLRIGETDTIQLRANVFGRRELDLRNVMIEATVLVKPSFEQGVFQLRCPPSQPE
jgi:hypothetical protein